MHRQQLCDLRLNIHLDEGEVYILLKRMPSLHITSPEKRKVIAKLHDVRALGKLLNIIIATIRHNEMKNLTLRVNSKSKAAILSQIFLGGTSCARVIGILYN